MKKGAGSGCRLALSCDFTLAFDRVFTRCLGGCDFFGFGLGNFSAKWAAGLCPAFEAFGMEIMAAGWQLGELLLPRAFLSQLRKADYARRVRRNCLSFFAEHDVALVEDAGRGFLAERRLVFQIMCVPH